MSADNDRQEAAEHKRKDLGLPEEDRQMLDGLQKDAFGYFMDQYNPDNGLIRDRTEPNCAASAGGTGFSLSTYPVAVEHGWIEREEAGERTLTAMRFLWNAEQSRRPHATGYKGFFYHFLDFESGRRAKESELSTIDTAILMAGIMVAGEYFNRETEQEDEIRSLAEKLYKRVDWRWASDHSPTLSHGWKPETGFLEWHWHAYSEALFLYIMALASPTHPLPPESYDALVAGYHWREIFGYDYLHAAPLFVHQFSHLWLDLEGIQDPYMREHGIDYFVNSQRATRVQQEYAIRNPFEFKGYGQNFWGITASDGPGPETVVVDGRERTFFDYTARGVPEGPDDGTVAPWATVASLPFVPEIVLPAIRHFNALDLNKPNPYGYTATINQTYPHHPPEQPCWISDYNYAINQGPVVIMIENYQSGFVWDLLRECDCFRSGLVAADFRGGWLESGRS